MVRKNKVLTAGGKITSHYFKKGDMTTHAQGGSLSVVSYRDSRN